MYCCHLMHTCTVCVLLFFTVDAGLLARSQYSEGPATGHLDTGFSWFPYVYKQMLRCFPRLQVATTCFSCSHTDLNLLVTNSIFCIHVKLPLPPGDNQIAVNKYYYVRGAGLNFFSEGGSNKLLQNVGKCRVIKKPRCT